MSVKLMNLAGLRRYLFQDRKARIGVLEKSEKVLIFGFGPGGVSLDRVASGELEMCQCASGVGGHNSAMIDEFLEFFGPIFVAAAAAGVSGAAPAPASLAKGFQASTSLEKRRKE